MESGKRKLLENPRESANLISRIFFGWTIPIFKRTYDRALDAGDASEPLLRDRSTVLGDRIERLVWFNTNFIWFQKWNLFPKKNFIYSNSNKISFRTWRAECKQKTKPSLVRAVVKAFWFEFLIMGILCFFNDVIVRLVLPFLLKSLLSYFR